MTKEELDKLTDEEKRVRIAELHGYKFEPNLHSNGFGEYLFTVGVTLNGKPVTHVVKRQTKYGIVDHTEEVCFNKEKVKSWTAALKAKPDLLPDYLNSLDACHEMENSIEDNFNVWMQYGHHLIQIALNPDGEGVPATLSGVAIVAHATARQRVEAFLLAVG